jgi:hypothetical protein
MYLHTDWVASCQEWCDLLWWGWVRTLLRILWHTTVQDTSIHSSMQHSSCGRGSTSTTSHTVYVLVLLKMVLFVCFSLPSMAKSWVSRGIRVLHRAYYSVQQRNLFPGNLQKKIRLFMLSFFLVYIILGAQFFARNSGRSAGRIERRSASSNI